MDIEKMKEIFQEVQEEFIEYDKEALKKELDYYEKEGKLNLLEVIGAYHTVSFNSMVGFTWEVMKRIEEYKNQKDK